MKPGRRPRHFLSPLAILSLAAALSMSSCDWIHYNFMNSIPFHGDPRNNPVVSVYLGIDGLSYNTVKEAQRRGAFRGMKLSRFISGFPATSDASWTRILRAGRLNGYEVSYYDPTSDSVKNPGAVGLMKHAVPTIAEQISFEPEYLKAFDYQGNGYTHSYEAYSHTFTSISNTMNNLFYLLDGRAETEKAFMGYVLEFDVLGHMQSFEDTVQSALILSRKIEKMKSDHPEREFKFTIFSDHGLDFIRVDQDRIVDFAKALKSVGIEPVKSLKDHDPSTELFAIPIEHVRVTYLALHTDQSLVPEVATRVSTLDSTDFAVGKLARPSDLPDALKKSDWFGIWSEGKLLASFGHVEDGDIYVLGREADYSRFGVTIPPGADPYVKLTDEELFEATGRSRYPDAFYRIRTGLSPVGWRYPADVLVSFKAHWAEMGFKLPGTATIASAGFHGSLADLGTLGTLLTDEKEVPGSVRADNLLDLFPRMREHIRSRGVDMTAGDPNASLDY